MSAEQASVPATVVPVAAPPRATRLLDTALFGLLGALLVDVLLIESWLQALLGTAHLDATGRLVQDLPGWPKAIKNALYITLFLVTLAKITLDRAWHRFRTPADWALVGLAAAMILAGALGGSSAQLIGDAVYVYLRGAIVFYAWRALDPPWRRVRPLLWLLGAIVVLHAAVALAQLAGGESVTRAVGWHDLQWIRSDRAQGLLEHPNHLGHVLALAMLGLLAWFVTQPATPWALSRRSGQAKPATPWALSRRSGQAKPATPWALWRWWALFGLLALALAASQSRESLAAFCLAAVAIGLLRRGRWRPVLASVLAVAVLSAALVALRPSSRAELARRLDNVLAALHLPAGAEPDEPRCIEGNENIEGCEQLAPPREVRLLYAQQGTRLLADRPLLGYGVGQFGGIVALQHDPQWNLDPRFGPGGFELYQYRQSQQQVDSFWLHLVVETGLVGLALYLLWMVLLVRPILRALPWRRGAGGPRAPAVHPVGYWAPAAWLVGLVVATLSPALEDPLFPPLLFSILGLAWVLLHRDELTGADSVH